MRQNPRDVDLVVCGSLSDARFDLVTRTKQSPESPQKRQVFLDSFCFTVEVKEHDSRGVEMCGTNMIVKYGTDKKDATSQSEDQKYSLRNYLNNVAPDAGVWICDFLWMQNLTAESIKIGTIWGCQIRFPDFIFKIFLFKEKTLL